MMITKVGIFRLPDHLAKVSRKLIYKDKGKNLSVSVRPQGKNLSIKKVFLRYS